MIFINTQREYYSLNVLCRTAEISKSTYYRLRNKKGTEYKYLDLIYKVFRDSHKTYGHRRIAIALRQKYSLTINKKKVDRLMRENRIIPEYHRKKQKQTRIKTEKFKKPNLVDRHFVL